MFGSIRRRLVLLVLVVALPLIGATILVVSALGAAQRETQREGLLGATRALSAAVDAEVSKHLAAARALSTARSLRNGEYEAFYNQATEVLTQLNGSWLIVLDAAGHQLINTLRPYGTALPNIPPGHPHFQAMSSRSVLIGDVIRGQVANRPVAGVFVPVIHDGTPAYDVIVVINPDTFVSILSSQRFPRGWLAGVIDRPGNFIARTRDQARLLGQPASASWREARGKGAEGFYEGPSLEGGPVLGAFSNLPASGWSVSIAADEAVLTQAVRHSLWFVAVSSVALVGLSIMLALFVGRRIAGPLRSMEGAAIALQSGERVAASRTGLREVDRALEAFDTTAATLMERERRQSLMVNELNHRVKNTLFVIQSIATLTGRSASSVKEFSRGFTQRLVGIARTHDLLTESHWSGAMVDDVVANELSPYRGDDPGRITISGPPVKLNPKMAMALGMVVHELATNATKYGALSVAEGRLAVTWTRRSDPSAVLMIWREWGGPPANAPTRNGFGSLLIGGNVREELGGRVDLDFQPQGLVCTLDFPLPDAASHPHAHDMSTWSAPRPESPERASG